MSEPVIDVSELTRRFGAKTALASVSLSVPRGAVYGLVGANGAGKTTLIKHVLGLLRAESGSVRVFGLDPVADPVAVLSRIGYLSEENDLPGWMSVDELIRYSRAFYPGLGRRLRGGAAADVRPRPRGEDQDPLQGAEGAGRTAHRARVSARAAGAGRAVVRPRSHRSPRHPRRRHSHHRPRRPHGALLVAPAGRGGAGRRPRHDDQPGQDRPERAARRHQGVAPARDRAFRGIAAASPRASPACCAGTVPARNGRRCAAAARASCRPPSPAGERTSSPSASPSLDEIFVAHVGTPRVSPGGVSRAFARSRHRLGISPAASRWG